MSAVPHRQPDLGPLPPDPRMVIEVEADEILVDRNAQRAIDEDRVIRIASDFDWDLFEMPTCSRRADGLLIVTEGQHRVLAVQHRDPRALLRVLELKHAEPLAIRDEADVQLRMARRRHNPLARWELKVRRGDPHPVAGAEVLRMFGLRLAVKASPTAISCISTVEKILTANHQTPEQGAESLGRVLSVIEKAYPRDEPDSSSTRWHSVIVQAVGQLVLTNPHLDTERLAGSLRDRIAQQWITVITNERPAWEAIADLLVNRYNKGLRQQRKMISL